MYTQCKVLAGSMEALNYIKKHAPNSGLSNIKMLPVNGAFHTKLMSPAVEPFKQALKSISISKPVVPVFSNFSGKAYKSENEIARGLIKQLVSPVKWEQSIQNIYERPPGSAFPRTFDVGSPGSMKYILRQINAKAWDSSFAV